jgi:hypothetical protein
LINSIEGTNRETAILPKTVILIKLKGFCSTVR